MKAAGLAARDVSGSHRSNSVAWTQCRVTKARIVHELPTTNDQGPTTAWPDEKADNRQPTTDDRRPPLMRHLRGLAWYEGGLFQEGGRARNRERIWNLLWKRRPVGRHESKEEGQFEQEL